MLGSRNWGQRGQTLVEFALTIPLLVLLLFAIIQYGLIFSTYISLRNGSAAGARYATLSNPRPTESEIRDFTSGVLGPMVQTNRITAVNVNTNVIISTSGGTIGGGASVEVRYNMPLIVPFVVPGRTNNVLPLRVTSVMR